MQLTYDDEDNQFSMICNHPDHEDEEITVFIEMPEGLKGIEQAYSVAKYLDQPGMPLFSDLGTALNGAEWDGLKGNIEKAIEHSNDMLATIEEDHKVNGSLSTDIYTILNESFTKTLEEANKYLASDPESVISKLALSQVNLYFADDVFHGNAVFMLPDIDFPMITVGFLLKGFSQERAEAMMNRSARPVLH